MRRTRVTLALLVAFAVMSVAVPEASAHTVRPRGFSTRAVLKERNTTVTSQLVAVRVGRHRTFERTVFELRGSLPSFESVKYVPRITEDGSGNPVPVAGRAFIEVVLMVQCGPGLEPGACPGAPGIPRGFRTIRQEVHAGYFESNATYGIGLSRRVGFRVFELSNPPRVVVDVRR